MLYQTSINMNVDSISFKASGILLIAYSIYILLVLVYEIIKNKKEKED